MRILCSALILLLALSQLALAQPSACWLCKRASPPHPLKTMRYTEARSVTHDICEFCLEQQPRCSICHSPTKVKPELDGRHICPDCKAVAIDTESELNALYADVQKFMTDLTGKQVHPAPPIRLVQKDEMDTRWVETSSRAMDAHAFYRAYNPEMIFVLSGHSARDVGPTLAHEFTHAWQSRHCPSQDRQMTEGFAMWVGYQYALARGYRDEANELLRYRDHDYGDGLRHCLAIEKTSGRKGLLKYVTTEAKFEEK